MIYTNIQLSTINMWIVAILQDVYIHRRLRMKECRQLFAFYGILYSLWGY